jgi:kynurenine formamidase
MKIIDLTQPLFHSCPAWPVYEPVSFTYEKVVGNDGYTAERINMNSHTGTHLDAPSHFFPDMTSIDQIFLERFIGKAHILNLEGIPPRTGIGERELAPYLNRIAADDIVLLHTGWSAKRSLSAEYYHDWPYLSQEGAELLLKKQVRGVGIDGLSVGGWYEGTGRPCHEVLLGNGVWLLEELNFPREILRYEICTLTAVPLLLRGFGGSPTRAYAVVDD